jgi:adenylyltransferase/sulfurtransferase
MKSVSEQVTNASISKPTITINIPTPLRVYTGRQKTVSVKGSTVEESIQELANLYSELKPHIFDETGKIRNFINIFLNESDIRYLQDKEKTRLKPGDTLSIIPSIAGGYLVL